MLKRLLAVLFFTSAVAVSAAAQEVEVDRYNITVRIDAAASAVDARASLSISNLGQAPKPKLFLRLTKLAKVTGVTVNGATAQVETVEDRRVTTLNQLTITPQASIEPGAKATIEVSYRLEAAESTATVHIYSGEVLLSPNAVWFPMPSTMFTLYGATTAPVTVNVSAATAAGNFRAYSSGTLKTEGQNSTFEQTLNSLPILVAGNYDQPVIADRGGVKIEVLVQPGIAAVSTDGKPADAKATINRLIDEAGRAIEFLTKTLGPPPAGATFRIISSVRAGNLTEPGVLVLNEEVFRRDSLSAGVVEVLADAVARMWINGRVRMRGREPRAAQDTRTAVKAHSSAFMSDSLPRYLAALYFEDRFGKDAANDLFSSMRWSYTPVAKSGRDAELGVHTLLFPSYSAAVFGKGPLVYRLLADAAGRERLIAAVKTLVTGAQNRIVTIDDLRAALIKGAPAEVDGLYQQWVETIIEPDIIVGSALASEKPGTQRVNVRNLGTGNVVVKLLVTTASGKQINGSVTVESENIATAEIPTGEKIVSIEADPDKLIIQTNYDNDARDADSKTTRLSAQTLLNQSIASFNKAQYPEAEAALRLAIRADSRNTVLHAWLARTLAAEKKMDDAAAEANAAIKGDPPSGQALAWARVTLGQVAMSRNQGAEAARQFRMAVIEADEAAAQLAAHEGLIQAERSGGAPSPVDESLRAYIAQLDAAIKQPASDKLFTLVIKNNLKKFVQGITLSRPAAWATEILHADQIDANRVALDVGLKVKTEGKDQAGTAVYILSRTGNSWILEDVPHPLFNVK